MLVAADDDGLTLDVDGGPEGGIRLSYSEIDKARTVFVWGSEAGPRGKAPPASKRGATAPAATQKKTTEKKRKQVATP